MTQYAKYDPTQPAPQEVTGWFDTAVFNYPNLPPASNLFVLTPNQWKSRMATRWAVSGNTLVPYVPPVVAPTQVQLATGALNGSVIMSSPTMPPLNGTFSVDASVQNHIGQEVNALLLNGTFADGADTVDWPDTAVPPVNHTMTVEEFKVFARAVGSFVAANYKVLNGTLATAPSSVITLP